MTPQSRDFWLSNDVQRETLIDRIRAVLHCAEDGETETRLRYLDSFDWRLYLAGAALEERATGSHRELIWRDLQTGATVARQTIDGAPDDAPAFIAAVPPGPVRRLLEPLLGVRRLLPMASMQVRSRTLRVLNDDDKTVVRILIEQHALIADDEDPRQGPRDGLPALLRLSPVRGYARELVDAERRLSKALNLALDLDLHPAPAPAPLFPAAMAAARRQPGAYSSGLNYQLDPGQRADAAAKEILSGLFDTLEANVDGTRRNLDSEFLHDLRVATRRTRSALSQIKAVFPQPIVDDFKGRFAWLQQVTGPMRDLDVYLLDFPGLRDSLPVAMRDDLEPLRDWLASHYAEEQSRLVAALDSRQFTDLRRDWRAFLSAAVPPSAAGGADNAERSIKAVADRRIRGMFKRVLREGRAITDASPAVDLHELRKSCKKLRYLMEFFQSLYPAGKVRRLIKQCKLLLDNLGNFQDLEVQAAHLGDTARRMHAEGSAGSGTLLSMGVLINNRLDGQRRARAQFAQTFARFDTEGNRATFDSLFRDRNGTAAHADAAPAHSAARDARPSHTRSGKGASVA